MDESKAKYNSSEQIKRTMKRTRRKMTVRIIRIFVVCMSVVFLLVSTPRMLVSLQSGRISEAQKFAMLSYEFATPNHTSGYSVETENGFSLNREISLFYRNAAGRSHFAGEQTDVSIEYNLLKGKLDMYYPIAGSFMHRDRYKALGAEYQKLIQEDNERALKALDKNRDNTVSLLDLSFANTYSIDEVLALVEDLDLEINWFAVETGMEKLSPPSNVGMPAQQYYTWGFPSKLYKPETIFSPDSLDPDRVQEHLGVVLEDLKWVEDHGYLVKEDRLWFIEQNLGAYLKTNGFMCYGIQVNGPTDQIVELIQKADYQYINIRQMEMWYW